MARYRNDLDNERDYPREERPRRENFGRGYDEPWGAGRQFDRLKENSNTHKIRTKIEVKV